MCKSFIRSCLEYGHLLCYGDSNTHLCRLDSLLHHAEDICSTTFPSLFFRHQATAFGLICKLLDGKTAETYSPSAHTFPPTTLDSLLVCLHLMTQLV